MSCPERVTVHGLQSNTLWQAGRVEESNTITKQHRRKVDLNLVNEPLPKALPRDIRANHQDVFACRSGNGSRYHIDDVARHEGNRRILFVFK